jgi:hypothetical protein
MELFMLDKDAEVYAVKARSIVVTEAARSNETMNTNIACAIIANHLP